MQVRVEVLEEKPGRLLMAMTTLILGAFLLAALCVPMVFNGVMYLGRTIEGWDVLRQISFEEIYPRLVMIFIAIGFIPALRWGGVARLADVGLKAGGRPVRAMIKGWLLGTGSVLILLLIGLAGGAYSLSASISSKLGVLFAAFFGGWLVGWIEEVLFRGSLLEAVRRVRGPLFAAISTSLLFAIIHYISPLQPDGVVYGHALSGFALLPHLIPHKAVASYFPFSVTVFLMSMVLCLIYLRQQHLYFIVGLHAGWVFMLQGGRKLLDRNVDVGPWLFGDGDNVARSWAAVVMLLVLGAFFLRKERAA